MRVQKKTKQKFLGDGNGKLNEMYEELVMEKEKRRKMEENLSDEKDFLMVINSRWMCTVDYNRHPLHVTSAPSLFTFRKRLKLHLFPLSYPGLVL